MPKVTFSDREFGYQGDYEYKGWMLEIWRNSDGTYYGKSQGYKCYTKSKRSIKLKRRFRIWVNSLPDLAVTDKELFLSNKKQLYLRVDFVGRRLNKSMKRHLRYSSVEIIDGL